MEDAHISVSPLSDQKSSLFAVFDGHGGKFNINLKEPKSPPSFKDTLYNSLRPTPTSRSVNMSLPLSKPSLRWTNSLEMKRVKNRSKIFKNN